MTNIGWQNASNAANQSRALNISSTAQEIGSALGNNVVGNPEMIGPFILGLFGFILYREEVPMDVSAAIMVPTVFFMGNYGFLPYGDGVIWGVVMAAAAIFAFGIAEYIGR